MKLALTVWNGRVSPVFDASKTAITLTFYEDGKIDKGKIHLSGDTVESKVSALKSEGVSALVCGAISQKGMRKVIDSGMFIYPFVSGCVEDVVEACKRGEVEPLKYSMPGCGYRNRGVRGRGRCRRRFN
ncbi:NifB/NifX family molybdenum-iron cluster-binding protein [candidate division WOR-3 bacterium]|nr:NifB/NifX family molybdenum-iron cluster-binding protein [candidate division WOR-3 bacterium]